METITVKSKQSLFDVAIEHFGAMEAVIDLAFSNDISMTDELPTSAELVAVGVMNERNALLFGNLYNKPATALSPEDIALCDELGPDPTSMGPFDYTFADTFDKQ